jgi:hypothetical protein
LENKEKKTKKEEQADFFKLTDIVRKTGYKATIGGDLIRVNPEGYEVSHLTGGRIQAGAYKPATGIIAKLEEINGRQYETPISETVDGFVNLTDEQLYILATAGVILLSSNKNKDHEQRFNKYYQFLLNSGKKEDY